MGRPPCCDKVGIKKGPWTPEEDIILVSYIQEHGPGNWRAVPTNTGLMRCSKSCRLRWTNYLRPGIKRGNFTPHEEGMIIHLQALLGNKWAAIATYLPQRTDNDIKNYWNTHLKKKLKKFQSGLEAAVPPQMGSDHHSSSANNYHQFMSKNYGDNQRVATTNFENNIINSKNNSSVYASSAENISRLLEGWMRSSSISDHPLQANTNSSSSSHQLYENRDKFYRDFGKINIIPINDQGSEGGTSGSVLQCSRPQQIEHEGANGINNPADHDHELECILSFDHHNLTSMTTGCDKSSCDSSQKGSESSGFMDHEKGDHFVHENKPKIDNHNNNPPLSFLEKWLLDESAGQVEMEIPSIF